jgi:uncharacterized protein YjiS (DUF1127 family)
MATVLRGSICRLVKALTHRRKVTQLLELDDHALADLGVSRGDVLRALSLPLHEDPSTALAALVNRAAHRRKECRP